MPRTRVDLVPRQLGRERPEHGDAAADGRLEPQRGAGPSRDRLERRPVMGDHALFAVTTGLPAPSAAAISVRAGSSPPISSTMTSIAGSATRCAGASVSSAGVDAGGAALLDVADGDRGEREPRSVGARQALRVLDQPARSTSRPTVPAPRTPTRSGARLIGRERGERRASREW